MPRIDLKNLEPVALGRYAFWLGRPIAANPMVAHAAREWAAGWRRGLAELVARLPADRQEFQVLPAEAQSRLLIKFRPDDVPYLNHQIAAGRSSAARTPNRA